MREFGTSGRDGLAMVVFLLVHTLIGCALGDDSDSDVSNECLLELKAKADSSTSLEDCYVTLRDTAVKNALEDTPVCASAEYSAAVDTVCMDLHNDSLSDISQGGNNTSFVEQNLIAAADNATAVNNNKTDSDNKAIQTGSGATRIGEYFGKWWWNAVGLVASLFLVLCRAA